jgi:hypothetical protein
VGAVILTDQGAWIADTTNYAVLSRTIKHRWLEGFWWCLCTEVEGCTDIDMAGLVGYLVGRLLPSALQELMEIIGDEVGDENLPGIAVSAEVL